MSNPQISPLILAFEGLRICLPSSTECLTTYVLQEQGDWFEAELAFVRSLLQPGDRVVDIGANYGTYSLAMAKAVGPNGRVLAYEPSSTATAYLRQSLALNGLSNVALIQEALSDRPGQRRLCSEPALELNALLPESQEGASGKFELVQATTLDLSLAEQGVTTGISFIKIDAEGEEDRILSGAGASLERQDPLIQFEIKAGQEHHLELIERFSRMGYQAFRLVPGLGVLVPFSAEEPIDGYLLNLFACKTSKAEELASRGLLVTPAQVQEFSGPTHSESPGHDHAGPEPLVPSWQALSRHPYALELSPRWSLEARSDQERLLFGSIAEFTASDSPELPAVERFLRLKTSLEWLQNLSTQASTPGVLASLARVAAAFGHREAAVAALQALIGALRRGDQLDPAEPFLAPSERIDRTSPRGETQAWLLAAALECFEQQRTFSSYFSDATSLTNYDAIASLGFASEETNRRSALLRSRLQLPLNQPTGPTTRSGTTSRPNVQPPMPWDHGYFSGDRYGLEVQRELSPNWLDFAAMIKGQRPPRGKEGEPFRYLELGCGMGYGLALVAAAYPEGSFIGVDFHPDHIAHGRWLAKELGLNNLFFIEADFLDLCRQPQSLQEGCEHRSQEGFHYVVAHGIATWVSPAVQEALLALASSQLRPGGLFYCSYNTYPGWLGRSTFHMLAQLERRLHHPTDPLAAMDQAQGHLQAALGNGQGGSPLGQALPGLAGELEAISRVGNTSYLCGEYGSEAWAPLYVAQMHLRCLEHKLIPVASATLPELFDELAEPSLRSNWESEAQPTLRAALMDLAINQAFRRDIFAKGRLPLRPSQQRQLLSAQRLYLLAKDRPDQLNFLTCFGEFEADASRYAPLEELLGEEPAALGELEFALGTSFDELLSTTALLIDKGRIGLERGPASAAACSSAQAVNRRLIGLMQEGAPYTHLVAPLSGSPVPFSSLEALILEAMEQHIDDDSLPGLVLMGLEAIGGCLRGPDGQPLEDPQSKISAVLCHAQQMRSELLPNLSRLGVL